MFKPVVSGCCISAIALLLTGCGTSSLVGTCGSDQDVEDCDHVDFGSCGNACCIAHASSSQTPESIMKLLTASLADGGPDTNWELPELFQGMQGFNKMDGENYLGQARHFTSGPAHYEDVVNILLEQTKTGTGITLFSTSLVGGALGDNGQNYKNIIMAMKSANIPDWDGELTRKFGACSVTPDPSDGMAVISKRRLDVEDVEDAAEDVEAISIPGTCGLNKTVQVSDCDRVDAGSCGNACCNLEVKVYGKKAAATVLALDDSLANGGPDGFYTKQMTAEGSLGFTYLDGAGYIGQVHHMTNGGAHHFNDTVNFHIYEEGNDSIIRAFSLSLVGGAYGDSGQNYKNIIMVLDASLDGFVSKWAWGSLFGCAFPNSTMLI